MIQITDIARLRLAAHRIADSSFASPAEVVEWMGAVQAQDMKMARWAVGVRLPESTEASVVAAMERGEILRTHVLRPTWHLVPARALGWMLMLTAPKIITSMRSRDRELGLDDALFARSNTIIARALEGGRSLTREQIGVVLTDAGVAVDSSRLYHFLVRAELDGVICSGAVKDGEHTYALLGERVAEAVVLSREEALAKLAYTYFSSHGPATMADFVWWSGLGTGEARRGVEAAAFLKDKIDGSEYFIPDALATTKAASPPRERLSLLPAFDEYIVAYRDRTPVLRDAHHSRAVSSNGVFRPVIVEDGVVTGLWRRTTGRKKPVTSEFFDSETSHDTAAAFERAAVRVREFFG